jgi:hypothetical protein
MLKHTLHKLVACSYNIKFENALKVERFMHVLGVFEMECSHLNFVELECGVGFGISTWGFWCLLWNVNVSKFEVGCCIVGVSWYIMIPIF